MIGVNTVRVPPDIDTDPGEVECFTAVGGWFWLYTDWEPRAPYDTAAMRAAVDRVRRTGRTLHMTTY